MPLNKPRGNMYDGYCTWNPYRWVCEWKCNYCYAPEIIERKKIWPDPRAGLMEKEMRENLYKHGVGQKVFVANMTDLFGPWVPSEKIERILNHCSSYPANDYLFQTKFPERLLEFQEHYPPLRILCTTIETNRDNITEHIKYWPDISMAPPPWTRVYPMSMLQSEGERVVITVEPILDFDGPKFITLLENIGPNWVYIGADSKRSGMPEPEPWKVVVLIKELRDHGITVKLKQNLKRLIGKESLEELREQ